MCRAVLVLSGAAARGMRARGAGKIVNVSSTAGFVTMGAYSAIKAWVTSFTEGLAVELRGTGIGVTALCPGWVHTEFHERAGIEASSIPNFLWLDAEQLVTACSARRRQGQSDLHTHCSVPKCSSGWLRHAPKSAMRGVSGSISSSRKKPVEA